MANKDKVDGVPFRTAYGAKLRVAIATGDGLTEQNHKDETDINNIVRKYNKTGLIDHLNQFEKQYGDMTGFDYQVQLEINSTMIQQNLSILLMMKRMLIN